MGKHQTPHFAGPSIRLLSRAIGAVGCRPGGTTGTAIGTSAQRSFTARIVGPLARRSPGYGARNKSHRSSRESGHTFRRRQRRSALHKGSRLAVLRRAKRKPGAWRVDAMTMPKSRKPFRANLGPTRFESLPLRSHRKHPANRLFRDHARPQSWGGSAAARVELNPESPAGAQRADRASIHHRPPRFGQRLGRELPSSAWRCALKEPSNRATSPCSSVGSEPGFHRFLFGFCAPFKPLKRAWLGRPLWHREFRPRHRIRPLSSLKPQRATARREPRTLAPPGPSRAMDVLTF